MPGLEVTERLYEAETFEFPEAEFEQPSGADMDFSGYDLPYIKIVDNTDRATTPIVQGAYGSYPTTKTAALKVPANIMAAVNGVTYPTVYVEVRANSGAMESKVLWFGVFGVIAKAGT